MKRLPAGAELVAVLLLLAMVALALAGWLGAALARHRRRRRLFLSHARGIAGEARAERLLVARGFRVLGRQVRGRYGVRVDGAELPVDVRADYLVSLDGARYVAEVKTGRAAPRIETPATRRQLLEYKIAFGVDGILLVDADNGHVREIDFPSGEPPERRSGALLIVVAIAGALLALAVERLAIFSPP